MRIIFVRHGKDDDNYRGGWSSLGLLEEGERQSMAVADYLSASSEYRIKYIVSSDLNRTLQTAGYIASALELPACTDARLREANNGILAGMLNEDAAEKYPGLFWNTLDMNEQYPGGESPSDFYQRIGGWFDEAVNNPKIQDGDMLVVTHGGVINAVYHLAHKLEWTNKNPSFPIANCSIHILNTDSMTFEVKNMVVWE